MKKEKNKFEELINEAFGGTPFKGGGTFSFNSQTGAKTWSHQSPPSRGTTTAPTAHEIEDGMTGIIQSEEEEAHMAPKVKPFPLENIDENLINAFIALGNAETQMRNCLKFNALLDGKKQKKKVLEFLHSKVKALRLMIKEISEDLERITIS
jgi:hypothetical protein